MKVTILQLLAPLSAALIIGGCATSQFLEKSDPAARNLFHSSPQIREQARQTLEKKASRDALEVLGGAYLISPDTDWKIALVNAMGSSHNPYILHFLLPIPNDPPVLADSVAQALGGLATPESHAALRDYYDQHHTKAAAFALLDDAQHLPEAEAIALHSHLWNTSQDKAVRAAALTELTRTINDPQAIDKLNCLDDPRALAAALRNLAHTYYSKKLPIFRTLADNFDKLSHNCQVLALNLLATLTPAEYAPTARQASNNDDTRVRTAAFQALAILGDTADFDRFLNAAKNDSDPDVRKAARQALIKGHWPVFESLIALRLTVPAEAPFAIELLRDRNCHDFNDRIIALINEANPELAKTAVSAIATLGTPQDAPKLFPLLNTEDFNAGDIRADVAAALQTILKRTNDDSRWDNLLADALVAPNTTDDARNDLTTLAVLHGGDRCFQTFLNTPALASRTIKAFSQWPNPAHEKALLDYARKLNNPFQRSAILRNLIQRAANDTTADAQQQYTRLGTLLDLSERTLERDLAIQAIAKLPLPYSLDAILFLAKSPKYTDSCARHLIHTVRQLPPDRIDEAIRLLKDATQLNLAEDSHHECEDNLRDFCRNFGYFHDWEYSPAFTAQSPEGKDSCPAAHSTAFAPEQPDDTTTVWTPAKTITKYGVDGIIELHKLLGGVQRTAYIRTFVTVSEDTHAVLEIGADDMVKVFLNGKAVFDKPQYQALKVASDRIPLTLTTGRNVIMLKVSQGTHDWEACAALKNPDGSPVSFQNR